MSKVKGVTIYIDGKENNTLVKSGIIQFPQIEKVQKGDLLKDGLTFYEVTLRAFIFNVEKHDYEIDMIGYTTVNPFP